MDASEEKFSGVFVFFSFFDFYDSHSKNTLPEEPEKSDTENCDERRGGKRDREREVSKEKGTFSREMQERVHGDGRGEHSPDHEKKVPMTKATFVTGLRPSPITVVAVGEFGAVLSVDEVPDEI